jgi:hypothetical protein
MGGKDMKRMVALVGLSLWFAGAMGFAEGTSPVYLKSVLYSVDLYTGKETIYCDVTTPIKGNPTYYFYLEIESSDVPGLRSAVRSLQAQLLLALAAGMRVEIDFHDLGPRGQMYAVRVLQG